MANMYNYIDTEKIKKSVKSCLVFFRFMAVLDYLTFHNFEKRFTNLCEKYAEYKFKKTL